MTKTKDESTKHALMKLIDCFQQRPILTTIGLVVVLLIVGGVFAIEHDNSKATQNQVKSVGTHNQDAGQNNGSMVQNNK